MAQQLALRGLRGVRARRWCCRSPRRWVTSGPWARSPSPPSIWPARSCSTRSRAGSGCRAARGRWSSAPACRASGTSGASWPPSPPRRKTGGGSTTSAPTCRSRRSSRRHGRSRPGAVALSGSDPAIVRASLPALAALPPKLPPDTMAVAGGGGVEAHARTLRGFGFRVGSGAFTAVPARADDGRRHWRRAFSTASNGSVMMCSGRARWAARVAEARDALQVALRPPP